LTKVLAKEVGAFNIRAMTVILGTFNTNFGVAASYSPVPLPEDYKGSFAEVMMGAISSGKFQPSGDREKGMKALYEIIVGEGAGAGKQSETFVFLGNDMVTRVKALRDALGHSLETFQDVANSVAAQK
jgi:NAD(P)-dependent dehydrogenase (short-subunit alcohol dehydrogenase family)